MTPRGKRVGATPPAAGPPPGEVCAPKQAPLARVTQALAERKQEVVPLLKGEQNDLAVRAAKVAHLALTKMEEVITKGTDAGQGIRVPCPPAALASIYREVRDTMTAPIKQDNEEQGGAPVQINTNNPAVIKAVIDALRSHREEQRIQAARTVEGELT